MQYLVLIGTVTLVHFLALISPGPDFIMTVRNSLSYSRKIGFWTSFGLCLGISVHIFYSIAGLALIISKSIIIFNFIKFLGAGYLIFIGVKSFFSKSSKIREIEKIKNDISKFKALKMGFFTNVLNPKVTLFFLSIFTFVISPDTPWFVILILGVIMVVNTFLWFSFVATIFTHDKIRKGFEKFQGIFNKIFGGLLVAIGLKVALTDK